MMKNPIFYLENGGRLIHEFDLYTSKYGMTKKKTKESIESGGSPKKYSSLQYIQLSSYKFHAIFFILLNSQVCYLWTKSSCQF